MIHTCESIHTFQKFADTSATELKASQSPEASKISQSLDQMTRLKGCRWSAQWRRKHEEEDEEEERQERKMEEDEEDMVQKENDKENQGYIIKF